MRLLEREIEVSLLGTELPEFSISKQGQNLVGGDNGPDQQRPSNSEDD